MSKKAVKAKRSEIAAINEKVACTDCWNEALMSVGIYHFTVRIPKDKQRAHAQAYDNWLYRSHEVEGKEPRPYSGEFRRVSS